MGKLVEINIPEEDGWHDDLATRVIFLVLGAVLMRFGLRLWAAVQPEGVIAAIPTTLCFAAGVQIAIFAAADIDYERWGREIGYGLIAIVTALTIAMLVQTGSTYIPRLGTDVLAFTSYSMDLVFAGANPFASSMAPSDQLFGSPDQWTYRVDGSKVVDWSYPAGTFFAYAPQFAILGRGPIGIRLSSILGVGLVAAVLVRFLPAVYGPVAPLALLLPQNQWLSAAGGLNDMWWALFAAVALVAWAYDRRLAAAALLGVACAMKQQPWPIAAFLAIWLFHDARDLRAFAREGGACLAVGLGAFGLLNLPWILANPSAWLASVLVPLGTGGAPLESMGVGFAVLNMTEGAAIDRSVFLGLIAVAIAGSLAIYWHWVDELRWAAWTMPAFIFLWTPRSLPSYFHWFVPIAVLALFASHGRLRGQPEVTA